MAMEVGASEQHVLSGRGGLTLDAIRQLTDVQAINRALLVSMTLRVFFCRKMDVHMYI